MALPNKEKYEQAKIDKLVQYLRLYHQKGQPVDYEILVDGFKAVRRTSDPDMFSMFENFVTADTRSLEVLLFTGSSNNNEKRIFYFGEESKEGLSGVEVKSMVDEEVGRKLRDKEFEALKEENYNLKRNIADLESEVDELEKHNARLEMKQSPLNNFLGDIGSNLVESFIKRNPKLMATIPGGETLAGLLQQDNAEDNGQPNPESEVSFKAKPDNSRSSTLTEENVSAIQFVNQLKSQFSKEEFDKILLILQTLADDKSKIDLILNHLNTASAKASA
jgi:FtsZ-binding cell division protein ZapB